ncbi:MAG TPA: PEGA domain-containing protein [Kofleriaceae bacterium]|jgi:tetratricopeptide (TPR) repeat protein
MNLRAILLSAVVAGAALASTASADDQPWAKGVSDAQQKKAGDLLEEGNKQFVQKDYVGALKTFRAALEQWDHPAIHFNIVRCLVLLDNDYEAVDDLEKALKYGPAPLEDAVYNEALGYQKLLAKAVGNVSVTCNEVGVALTLDAQSIGQCPTTNPIRVKPGAHQLVAEKKGFVPRTMRVVVVGGTEEKARVELQTLSQGARVVHRFATWKPWAVFGGGLLVTGVGGLVQLTASNDMDSYDNAIDSRCSVGCMPSEIAAQQHIKDRAKLENKIAIGVMSVGAVATVAGAVMLILNRGVTIYEQEPPHVGVVPVDGGGVMSYSGSF